MTIIATAAVPGAIDREVMHHIAAPSARSWWVYRGGLSLVNIGVKQLVNDDLVFVVMSPESARLLAAALVDGRTFRVPVAFGSPSAYLSVPAGHTATLVIITRDVLIHTALHADQPRALAAALTTIADQVEGRSA